ncbi:hypothetical protein M0811_11145 [Anaeramoeba ignava]|uniref:Uncharacterized protein n=1 Tax=Anaeramoeba ignava TaxID=1746090 RepID=A0A9Q0LCE3_ANAIG|nr:hypothetical protein M0811_11145 [Anaeramoeba ignava]
MFSYKQFISIVYYLKNQKNSNIDILRYFFQYLDEKDSQSLIEAVSDPLNKKQSDIDISSEASIMNKLFDLYKYIKLRLILIKENQNELTKASQINQDKFTNVLKQNHKKIAQKNIFYYETTENEEKSNIYDLLTSIYFTYSHHFPLREHVLICDKYTSKMDIRNFLRIYKLYNFYSDSNEENKNKKKKKNKREKETKFLKQQKFLFTIMFFQKLKKRESNCLIKELNQIDYFAKYPLLILFSGDSPQIYNLKQATQNQKIENFEILSRQNIQLIFDKYHPKSNNMKVFTSEFSGCGKTYQIRKYFTQKTKKDSLFPYSHIILTSGTSFEIINKIYAFLDNSNLQNQNQNQNQNAFINNNRNIKFNLEILNVGSNRTKRSISNAQLLFWKFEDNFDISFEIPSNRGANSESGLRQFTPLKFIQEFQCELKEEAFEFIEYEINENFEIERKEDQKLKKVARFIEIAENNFVEIDKPNLQNNQEETYKELDKNKFWKFLLNTFTEESKEKEKKEQLTFRLLSNFWKILKSHIDYLFRYMFFSNQITRNIMNFKSDDEAKKFTKEFFYGYIYSMKKLVSRSFNWTFHTESEDSNDIIELSKIYNNRNEWDTKIDCFLIPIFSNNSTNFSLFENKNTNLLKDKKIRRILQKNGFNFFQEITNKKKPTFNLSEALKILTASNTKESNAKVEKKRMTEVYQNSRYVLTSDNFMKMIYIRLKLFRSSCNFIGRNWMWKNITNTIFN